MWWAALFLLTYFQFLFIESENKYSNRYITLAQTYKRAELCPRGSSLSFLAAPVVFYASSRGCTM